MHETYLNKLVSFYSVTSDQHSVKLLLNYVQTELAKSGLESVIFENKGVFSLYAHTQKDKKHSRVLLQGHIDVVSSESNSFTKRSGKYYGRGVYDMLFATACYLQYIHENRTRLQGMDLALFLSGDEETGGFNSIPPFLKKGYSTDICILPDAGNGLGSLNVGAKGVYNCTIQITGKSHHGSRPWEGDGAAIKVARFLCEVDEMFDTKDQNNSTVTVAKITSGDVENRGPASAQTILDIRYKDRSDLLKIQSDLNKLMKKYDGTFVTVNTAPDYRLDLKNELVIKFLDVYEQHLGHSIELTRAHGSSDARFFSEINIPVIMFRPDGGGAHGDDEWISTESIEKFYVILNEYITKVATIGESI